MLLTGVQNSQLHKRNNLTYYFHSMNLFKTQYPKENYVNRDTYYIYSDVGKICTKKCKTHFRMKINIWMKTKLNAFAYGTKNWNAPVTVV